MLTNNNHPMQLTALIRQIAAFLSPTEIRVFLHSYKAAHHAITTIEHKEQQNFLPLFNVAERKNEKFTQLMARAATVKSLERAHKNSRCHRTCKNALMICSFATMIFSIAPLILLGGPLLDGDSSIGLKAGFGITACIFTIATCLCLISCNQSSTEKFESFAAEQKCIQTKIEVLRGPLIERRVGLNLSP